MRFHGLLSDDFRIVVRDRKKLFYSFFNCDQVFDFLLSIGMRPFVELSFMPSALASRHHDSLQLRSQHHAARLPAVVVDRTARITLRRALRPS